MNPFIQNMLNALPGIGNFAGKSTGIYPMLEGSQYIQQQLKGLGVMADPGRSQPPKKQDGSGRQVGQQAVLGGKPVYWGGDNYGWQQLNQTGSSATLGVLNTPKAQNRFVQEQGFRPIGGTPEERAFAAEKTRVAQLTAQDPELQRYEAARKLAVAPGATPEQVQSAENIGMQIWQQKYGNTPMGQPGGAVGRNNPLMDRTFGYQSGSAPGQQIGEPTLGPSPLVPQVDQSLNPASPNYIGGEGAPLMNFADPRFENMSPEDFQKLLNQVNKK